MAAELAACNASSSYPAFWASGPVHTPFIRFFGGTCLISPGERDGSMKPLQLP